MNIRKWTVVILFVVWLGWELYAAFDGSAATWPLTQVVVTYVPAPVGLAGVALFASWVVTHFVDEYRKRGISTDGGSPMPMWLIGAVRTGLQFGWTLLIGFALKHGITLPEDAPAWVDEAALGLVMALFVAAVQWAEKHKGVVGWLARVLMLGAKRPVYVKPPIEPPAAVGELRQVTRHDG